MYANAEFEVFCPFDGDVVTVVDGVTAPGWFVVLHENDEDGLHTIGVYIATDVTT